MRASPVPSVVRGSLVRREPGSEFGASRPSIRLGAETLRGVMCIVGLTCLAVAEGWRSAVPRPPMPRVPPPTANFFARLLPPPPPNPADVYQPVLSVSGGLPSSYQDLYDTAVRGVLQSLETEKAVEATTFGARGISASVLAAA